MPWKKGCSKKSLLDPFGQMGRQPMPEKGSIGIAYAAYAAPAPLQMSPYIEDSKLNE